MQLTRTPWRVLEALATPHGIDRYLELVDPMLTVRELRARVAQVQRHPHAVTLTLRPNHRWTGFRAGQWVQVAVDIDGVRHTRSYSPTNSEHRRDGCIELTVRAHDRGRVSQYLHQHASPGLVIGISAPQGEFTLPDPRPDRVLLISGGSGITPVLAMLRTLCDEQHRGEITLLHYAPDAAHVPHADELRRLEAAAPNVTVRVVHSRGDVGDLAGRFGPDHLAAVAPWYREAQTFVCGPSSLESAVRELWDADGLGDRVHAEQFTLVPVTPVDVEVGGTVTFARTGTQAPNSGATLLEQAEAAGLTPEYGCRMGICFSCVTPKLSGCTRDVRTGELHRDPDTEIQLCISAAVGDVALDI